MSRPLPILPVLALLVAAANVRAQAAAAIPEPPGMQAILPADLQKWAKYLASEELQGRLTGSRGQRLAASLIAEHLASLGLEPLGDKGEDGKRGFLQRYPLTRTSLDLQATSIVLGPRDDMAGADGAGGADDVAAAGAVRPSGTVFRKGFAVIPAAGKGAGGTIVEGEFVYAGLVNTRTFEQGVDLEDWNDKIPVFVIKLPKAARKLGIERQMMTGMFLMSSLKRRTDKLAKRGAKVALYCVLDDNSSVTNMLTYTSIAPGQDMMERAGSPGMGTMMKMMAARMPAVFLTRKVSLAILASLGLTEKTATQGLGEAQVRKLRQAKGSIELAIKTDPRAFATNVIAVLRGADRKLGEEALIYSAHMDHIGVRMDGDVYNGADDNASGSAGLMAIAKAFASTARAPRRSVIFLSVSGEELGLWGSAYFADHPTWDIDDIVADINTDMIGRNGPESGPMSVTVTPSNRHKMFSTIVRDSAKIAEQMGLAFASGDKYYQRSDHFNFARKGIPVVFFCNGEHEDYHQVTDHAEKLDFDKMLRITRLAYWTGYRVAVADERPHKLGRSSSWRGDAGK